MKKISLTTIKRVTGALSFRIHNPKVALHGKGIVNRIHCECRGENNSLYIEGGASLTRCRLIFKGNNNTVRVKSGTHLRNITFWCEGGGNKIEIGRMVTMGDNVELAACEGKTIVIGDDSMFSHDIAFRTTDSHSIIDAQGRRLNMAKDIVVGKHVWIGLESLILKGCTIPDNCIVGAKSLVSASLDVKANSIIAGNPAKVIKENINWCRKLL